MPELHALTRARKLLAEAESHLMNLNPSEAESHKCYSKRELALAQMELAKIQLQYDIPDPEPVTEEKPKWGKK